MISVQILILSFVILIILIFSSIVESVEISEIMYNPEGDDSLYEFLEMHSENHTDLSNFIFEGIDFTFPYNYTFEGIIILASSNEGFSERYNFSPNFTYKGTLKNSGESLILHNNITILLNVSYSDSVKEGHSLEFNGTDYYAGDLYGSPGAIKKRISIVKYNETYNETGDQSVNKSEVKEDKKDNIESEIESCDPQLDFEFDKEIYVTGDTVYFSPIIKGLKKNSVYELTYHIEDSSGRIVKKKISTQNSEKKRYTPAINGRYEVQYLRAELITDCVDYSVNKSKAIVIQNKDEEIFSIINMPSFINYGDNLEFSIEILADLSRNNSSSNLTVTLRNILDFSFDPGDYFKGKISVKVPDECRIDTYTGKSNLIIEYNQNTVTKEIIILPSKKCNLPTIKRVYRLSRDLAEKNNISVYVSFDLKNVVENDTMHIFYGSQHYSRKLDYEISPLAISVNLEKGNKTVHVELLRGSNILDAEDMELSVEGNGENDENKGNNIVIQSDEKQGEMFKNEIGLSEKEQSNGVMPQIPRLYYLIFGISVVGNVFLLWKS